MALQYIHSHQQKLPWQTKHNPLSCRISKSVRRQNYCHTSPPPHSSSWMPYNKAKSILFPKLFFPAHFTKFWTSSESFGKSTISGLTSSRLASCEYFTNVSSLSSVSPLKNFCISSFIFIFHFYLFYNSNEF